MNHESAATPRLRVLVAEDEVLTRLDLTALLEESGFEVCAQATNGHEAVELSRTTRPDVAILDVEMPEMSGIDAARRILGDHSIPVVMLTAHARNELIARAVEAGVYAYLLKPFRAEDLAPTIEAARARHADVMAAREVGQEREPSEAGTYYLSGYGYMA